MGEPIMAYTAQRCEWAGPDPGKPGPGVMQIFYDGAKPKMIEFLCPCGCGNTCPTHVVTFAEKDDPDPAKRSVFKDHCWGFDAATLTIRPSIRWTGGCYAHFHITNGKTELCSDSGRRP